MARRPVAQCYAGADDLQEQMVLAGWAWAYMQYSDRYVPEEKDAMARKVGVHAHRCQAPWEWRAQQRAKNGQYRCGGVASAPTVAKVAIGRRRPHRLWRSAPTSLNLARAGYSRRIRATQSAVGILCPGA
jgi:hypothetical protein